jgi:opine dehydrogenase
VVGIKDQEALMQITVLGAGAGGTAVAFDCASHGHDVRVFDFEKFPENIAMIAEQGGINAVGDIAGFGPIDCRPGL